MRWLRVGGGGSRREQVDIRALALGAPPGTVTGHDSKPPIVDRGVDANGVRTNGFEPREGLIVTNDRHTGRIGHAADIPARGTSATLRNGRVSADVQGAGLDVVPRLICANRGEVEPFDRRRPELVDVTRFERVRPGARLADFRDRTADNSGPQERYSGPTTGARASAAPVVRGCRLCPTESAAIRAYAGSAPGTDQPVERSVVVRRGSMRLQRRRRSALRRRRLPA